MVAKAKLSRRLFVKSAVMLVGGAALEGVRPSPATAQTKLSKAAVKYQTKPNGEKECDDCIQFVPGASADAMGTCKVVEGEISPHGYCIAFVAKKAG